MTAPALLRDESGGSAAEFALVLPLLLAFLLGIIDVGRFAWEINRGEKATQMGTRMAVVTDLVAPGLESADYVGVTVNSRTLTQGDRIPAAALGVVSCTSSACTCATGSCPELGTRNGAAFQAIVDRMRLFAPAITGANVVVEYSGSGLGYAGDPGGMEVSPMATVRLRDMSFEPITLLLFSASVPLPSFSYSLTMEDGDGARSN